jgi:hypothetical protein
LRLRGLKCSLDPRRRVEARNENGDQRVAHFP